MNSLLNNMAMSISIRPYARRIYRALQKHLDTMPIGYPSTRTGVELSLLAQMFTGEEAEAALSIGWRPETFDEIYKRARLRGFLEEDFQRLIDSMASKGCIFSSASGGRKRYACHPLVIGMYGMQLKRLTSNLYLDLRNYMLKGFSVEYYTSEVRQMRVIPVHGSVTPQLAVAAYDDIRQIVDQARGRISVSECICKVARDFIGERCVATDRRELCMQFRDYHDIYTGNGWGRAISRQEALEILDQNEKEGMVLMPTSLKEPQFVCSCCRCCCSILELVGIMPRSADFVESNYMARLDAKACTGCGRCKTRCQMRAILFTGKKAICIDERKCIGCGLCVTCCPANVLVLVRKDKEFSPPRDLEELYQVIAGHRKNTLQKYYMMLKAFSGNEV